MAELEPWQVFSNPGEGEAQKTRAQSIVDKRSRMSDENVEPWNAGFVNSEQSILPRELADIPKETAEEFNKGLERVKSLAGRDPTKEGTLESIGKTGSGLLGVPQMGLSWAIGPAKSVGGHLIARAERGIGSLINPELVAAEPYETAYEAGKEGVDKLLAAVGRRIPGGGGALGARPTGIPPLPEPVVPPSGSSGEIAAAAERLAETTGEPVRVPRAIASDSMIAQRGGQAIRNVPIVGDAIPRATGRLIDDLGIAAGRVADVSGQGTGPNVAGRIGRQVSEAGTAETSAAEAAARRSDEAVRNAWQTDVEGANAGIAAQEARAGQEARTAVGPDMTPQEMGQTLIQRLRTTEREARAHKEALYARTEGVDASVRADEISNVTARVGQALADQGVNLANTRLTPAANEMWQSLERLARLEVPHGPAGGGLPVSASEPPARLVGLTAKALNEARKELVFLRSNAQTPGDQRAASIVMRAFDDWHAQAFENALLSGDPRALAMFREAAEANTNWRRRFYDAEDDAGGFINRVVTGEVTPQEVANLIVGSGQVGAKGVASRLLTRLHDAIGADAEATQALRSGVWNRLSETPEGVTPKTARKIADDIGHFLNDTGSDVAHRLFTADQRTRMQAYADALRSGQEDRALVADIARTTEPTPTTVAKGPAQQLADTVVGKGKSDEALFRTIDDYARSGGRADIQSLAKLVRTLPQQDRGDLAGALIRNLGKTDEVGGFSADKFATNWDKYTPQAKALLFGNAGPQLQALNDIAAISQRLKDVGKRFGNPSGTAQNVNLLAVLGGLMIDPVSTVGTAVGGGILASVLASPVGASNASRWAKAFAAVKLRPTAATLTAYQSASQAMANAARDLGSNTTVGDFMKAVQAPGGRTAQDENNGQR